MKVTGVAPVTSLAVCAPAEPSVQSLDRYAVPSRRGDRLGSVPPPVSIATSIPHHDLVPGSIQDELQRVQAGPTAALLWPSPA
jgi:hypothetical protein